VDTIGRHSHPGAAGKSGVPWRKILVGTDFSRAAESALRTAVGLARGNGGRVYALHVVNVVVPSKVQDNLPGLKRLFSEEAQAELERALGLLNVHDVPIERIVKVGVPHDEIVRTAEQLGADLILIGKSRTSDHGPAWLGSTAEQVTRLARCAALVVIDA
jgi:nucleotide-binding universal stress UspA family protein